MKKTTLRLLLIAILLATASTPVLADGGGNTPWCLPGHNCQLAGK